MRKARRSSASRLAVVLAVVLIVTGQIGCAGGAAPVAHALKNVVYWLGQKAAESAVFVGVERLLDRIFGQHDTEPEMEVDVDALNPLRGRCKGPVTLQNADDKNKSYLLVDFPVYRDAVGVKWKVDPDHVRRIESALKGN